jgi:hypothetical protein
MPAQRWPPISQGKPLTGQKSITDHESRSWGIEWSPHRSHPTHCNYPTCRIHCQWEPRQPVAMVSIGDASGCWRRSSLPEDRLRDGSDRAAVGRPILLPGPRCCRWSGVAYGSRPPPRHPNAAYTAHPGRRGKRGRCCRPGDGLLPNTPAATPSPSEMGAVAATGVLD